MPRYIDADAVNASLDRIREEVWLHDIPSPTVPEYIEHHETMQRLMIVVDKERERLNDAADVAPVRCKDCENSENRYIDARLVDEVMHNAWINRPLDSDRWVIEDIKKALSDLPSADVAPVRHGQMRYKAAYKGAEFGFYFCSECRQPFWWGSLNYCPHRYCSHCGAKMDGGAIGDPMEDDLK